MKNSIIVLITFFVSNLFLAQSDNCNTATVINLDANGLACVNGTNANATSDNILYGGCNPVDPVNEVWYTYVASGSQNNFQIDPGTMQDAQIVIYTGGCNGSPGSVLETCEVATGANILTLGWGIAPGTQVWIGVMSNSNTDGTFELCIDSNDPPPTGGNTCAGAIPVCEGTIVADIAPLSSSGTTPSCFFGTVNQDVWFTFEVLQGGTFEWSATPSGGSTDVELDWALYDISGGCPGTEISCNYNYAGGNNDPNGQVAGSTTNCPTDGFDGAAAEFCPPDNLAPGTYAIVVDYFSSSSANTMDFTVGNGSAVIAPVADFTINPNTVTCASSVTVSINDNSIGVPDWDFGDGTTYTGNNPPDHTYSTPGTYAITATIGGACPSTHTEFVELFGPLSVTGSAVDETCLGDCDGSVSVNTSGGSGNYSYSWDNSASTSPTISNLCANDYTVTVTDAICNTSENLTLTVGGVSCCIMTVDAGADANVCLNNTIALNGSYIDNNGGVTIGWTSNPAGAAGDLSSTTVLNPTFNPSTAYGTVEFVLSVTDNSCTITDTVYITVIPNITGMTCPGPLTAVCDITEQPAYVTYTDFQNAGGSVTLTAGATLNEASFNLVSEVSDGLTCPETVTRTYEIADDCGLFVQCTQTITIDDNINPTGTAPADVAVQCAADVPAADPLLITDEADNCGVPTVTHVGDVSDGLTCPETITRTYRIEDACGNFIEVTQLITVNDNIAPTGTAPANVAVQCLGDVPAADPLLITDEADNCTVPTVTHVGDVSDGLSCPETITRTYRIEDACGNFIEVDQIITVNDDINPTGTAPANVIVECDTDVPAADPLLITDEADNCTVAPTVAHVSDVSDNNVCNGEIITRTYSITDDCGNFINVTQTITIDSYTPTFTLAGTDPSVCGGTDGFITVSGLDPNTDYTFEYDGNAPITITTDAAGEYVITGLGSGSYTGFTVSDVNCPACSTTDGQTITLTDPNPPAVSAGPDQQVCEGSAVTLTATNPDGAIITWNNGVVDGVAFTPAVGTVTYTVTADLAGCINTDQVDVTVIPQPVIDPLANQVECDSYTLPAITGTNLTGTEAYYTGTGGTGTQLNAGDVITTAGTTTLFIYDETGTTPNCFDEQTFDVTINLTPAIDPLADQVECDSYTLPVITGTNLTGTEAYYTGTGGTGTQINAGDAFTTAGTTTLYIYDETATVPNCFDEQTFTVTINLTPVIDPLANQVECDSYTLPAITGTNLTGGEAYYTGIGGTGTQLNAGDAITTAGTTTLYIYDETGTTPNCSNEQTFDVTINLTPVIDLLANQVACDSYTLSAITGTNLTGNEAYYTGSGGTGTQYNAGDAITAAGTTTLYIYDETGTTPNCFDEQTIDITINITPTFTLSSTDPTACGAADGTITISGLEPNTAYDVTYSDGGTPVGPNSMNSDAAGDIVIGGLTAGSYSDFVVTLNGCTTTDNSSINLVDPNAPAVNAGVDQEVCDGEQVTLTADNPDGANISWNNGVTDGVAFTPGVGTVTYTVTANLAGCISTDQVNVTVHPNPTVLAGNDVLICEGESVTLTGSGADDYTWDNGVTNGVSFNPTATQTYTVIGTTTEGCQGTDDVVVTVEPLPSVSFVGDNLEGCVPVMVTFTNTSSTPGDECVWNFGDGSTAIGCEQVTHTFNNVGCFDVTLQVTSANGCTSSFTENDYVCTSGYPIAAFGFSPDDLTTINTNVNFTNNSLGANSYEWNFGDGQSSTDVNPSHEYPAVEDTFVVELIATSSSGCQDTAYAVIKIWEELIFYVPNTFTPDGDDFNEVFKPIFTSGFDPFDYKLLIFNRWGEVVFESNNPDVGWDGTYGADRDQLVKDGTYVWKIIFKTKRNDERIVEVGHVNILR